MAYAKLNNELVSDITMYRGHGLSWREISRKTGIRRATMRQWLRDGENATRNNIKKKLYDEVGKAEAEVVFAAARTIIHAATAPLRITKIKRKEILDKEGKIITLTTTTWEGPSLKAAEMLVKFGKRWRKALSDALFDEKKDTDERLEKTNRELIDALAEPIDIPAKEKFETHPHPYRYILKNTTKSKHTKKKA